jgi:hypothetical protein
VNKVSLSIDMTPVWDAINTDLPVFFAILAPIIGIMAAIAIVSWLGKKIVEAFRGNMV